MSEWNYTREDPTRKPRGGKKRCVILDAVEAKTKTTGTPMIAVTVQPSGSKAKVKKYIVKNDYFNKEATALFDAFPEIGEGNFNFAEWRGAMGAAMFAEDQNGYLVVRYWINPAQAADLPEFEGEKPEKQTVTELGGSGEGVLVDNDDDLPFTL
jgi:hypothetical protein